MPTGIPRNPKATARKRRRTLAARRRASTKRSPHVRLEMPIAEISDEVLEFIRDHFPLSTLTISD